MSRPSISFLILVALSAVSLVVGQQQCYYGPGAEHRAPAEANLVPCLETGQSACCLLGDTCLSGNACYNYLTGNTYTYGCTDVNYSDETCPFKCGFNSTKSPWSALEYCAGVNNVEDTWICHAPESCGCQWNATYDLLTLSPRGCADMGDDARVALYAPSALAPYVSLPSTYGGPTLYYSGTTVDGTSTWISTALESYTPKSIGPLTTYATPAPTEVVVLFPNQHPAPSTNPAAVSYNATITPVPNGVWSGGASSTTSTSSPTTDHAHSIHTVTQTPTTPPSSGLSTGAKAGIGVGVAGAACAAVALGAIWYILRRRRNRETPELQPPGFSEKSPAWAGPPPGSPPPNDGFYQQSYGYQGVPAMIHEAGATPGEEEGVRKALSPPLPPMELEGEGRAEMDGGPHHSRSLSTEMPADGRRT
ncbi:hypothetical protein LTR09_009302 [Extremus antarcticus]|uniref:Uncharacterized protein n=1 Tax=Extremus antarcticus TaxID=702011 RepID=A0AAJ0G9K6_9PEZI|nr:hypothetical protein LTR09_009302 [Extremus antarcticus]